MCNVDTMLSFAHTSHYPYIDLMPEDCTNPRSKPGITAVHGVSRYTLVCP